MIKEFDELEINTSNVSKLSENEKKERAKKREALLAKMSSQELNTLLKRPYPSQFKEKIKKYLNVDR